MPEAIGLFLAGKAFLTGSSIGWTVVVAFCCSKLSRTVGIDTKGLFSTEFNARALAALESASKSSNDDVSGGGVSIIELAEGDGVLTCPSGGDSS